MVELGSERNSIIDYVACLRILLAFEAYFYLEQQAWCYPYLFGLFCSSLYIDGNFPFSTRLTQLYMIASSCTISQLLSDKKI